MLEAFLSFQRGTARLKVNGLTNPQAHTPLLATSPALTPAGIIRHLAAVERAWFRIVMCDSSEPDIATPEDPKAMAVTKSMNLTDLVTLYETECTLADQAVADLEVDDIAAKAGHDQTLRWVFCHMIEETARHNGHLDLLRERIDGRVGQ
jgi:hypothetical protein